MSQDKEDKPLYVTSYIKAIAQEESGTKSIDKSVFEAVQNAIKSVLHQGFVVKNGKAFLRISGDEVEQEREAPEPKTTAHQGAPTPVVLIKVVDGRVLSTHSDIQVEILDLDRIGRMAGNKVYEAEVLEAVETLRAIAPRIKNYDCKWVADELEAIQKGAR